MKSSRIQIDRSVDLVRAAVLPQHNPIDALVGTAFLEGGLAIIRAAAAFPWNTAVASAIVFRGTVLVGATAICALGIISSISKVFAREEFVISKEELTITWHLLGLRYSRVLRLADISDVHLQERSAGR